jgi:hypothetical protein
VCVRVCLLRSRNQLLEGDVQRHRTLQRQKKTIIVLEQKLAWVV